jgi:alkylation response protein AidB-like acyl-CoA dehydrogenase
MRIMSSTLDAPPAAMVTKLFWATVHRDLGELAMDVLGAEATLRTAAFPDGRPDYTRLQRLFLFSRSDTIYAGTNQIQRNIIGERALGLPKEPS